MIEIILDIIISKNDTHNKFLTNDIKALIKNGFIQI